MYRLKAMSQPVVLEVWLSLRSLPPKQAMVAFVVTDMFGIYGIRKWCRKERPIVSAVEISIGLHQTSEASLREMTFEHNTPLHPRKVDRSNSGRNPPICRLLSSQSRMLCFQRQHRRKTRSSRDKAYQWLTVFKVTAYSTQCSIAI